jgi:hypothetical protein
VRAKKARIETRKQKKIVLASYQKIAYICKVILTRKQQPNGDCDMSKLNAQKVMQWKNEVDVCKLLLGSRPDDENLKMRLLIATDEYEKHRNPVGYKNKNGTKRVRTPKEPKVARVRPTKEPKPEIIRFNALKRYNRDGVLIEHYKLVRGYVRGMNPHHKVYVNAM